MSERESYEEEKNITIVFLWFISLYVIGTCICYLRQLHSIQNI